MTAITKEECLKCKYFGFCVFGFIFENYPGCKEITWENGCPKDWE